MSASCLFAANHLSRTHIHNAVQIQKIYFALQAVTRNTKLPRNHDPVHLLFHVVYPTPSEGWGHRSDSSCFDIYSFLRPLIIRAGHLRWKLTKLLTTFGKKIDNNNRYTDYNKRHICNAYCTFGR